VYLGHSELDVEIERIGRNSRAIPAFSPARFFGLEHFSASVTVIAIEVIASDPSFDSAMHKFEIGEGLAVPLTLEDFH
jgi:hypothetical protein